MDHFEHALCNAKLLPADGDEDDVDTLAVQQARFKGSDIRVVRSFWKPSPDELALLNSNGCVVLCVWGTTHPPVRVDAMP